MLRSTSINFKKSKTTYLTLRQTFAKLPAMTTNEPHVQSARALIVRRAHRVIDFEDEATVALIAALLS